MVEHPRHAAARSHQHHRLGLEHAFHVRLPIALLAALLLLAAPVLAQQGDGTGSPLPVPQGGTGAGGGAAAAANLSLAYVVCAAAPQAPHTGDATETTLGTCTIPGGVMGATGCIAIYDLFSRTNNADTVTYRVRLNTSAGGGAAGGIAYSATAQANTATSTQFFTICNTSATAQIGFDFPASFGGTANAVQTSAINTANPVYVNFSGQLGTTTDTVTLQLYWVQVMPSAGN
jgi:hypothetical protein